jgi:hypothetical protein
MDIAQCGGDQRWSRNADHRLHQISSGCDGTGGDVDRCGGTWTGVVRDEMECRVLIEIIQKVDRTR